MNAILGEQVLPTSHHASTLTLCEIKYGTRKQATVHMTKGHHKSKEDIDLTTEEGRRILERFVSPGTMESAVRLPEKEIAEESVCSQVEIFWPFDFLQVATFINLLELLALHKVISS